MDEEPLDCDIVPVDDVWFQEEIKLPSATALSKEIPAVEEKGVSPVVTPSTENQVVEEEKQAKENVDLEHYDSDNESGLVK